MENNELTDQDYYNKVSDIVAQSGLTIRLDFDTVIDDKRAGTSPEESANLFIKEYNEE